MLMCSGETPKVPAMVGNAVDSTVLSRCSINNALETINAVVRTLGARGTGLDRISGPIIAVCPIEATLDARKMQAGRLGIAHPALSHRGRRNGRADRQ